MGKAVKKIFVLAILLSGIASGLSARAQIFGELIADYRAYLNPEGKYEIVYTPVPPDPFLWEIDGSAGFNKFDVRRMLVGYHKDISENALAEVAIRIGETDEEGREVLLDRAYFQLSNPDSLYYEFKFGYFQTPGLEWTRNNFWQWDMFEYPMLEYLGLVSRSQLGVSLGAGVRLSQFETGLGGGFFNGGYLDDDDFDQYLAFWTARLSLEKFSASSIIGYTLNGEKEKEGYQELWQYGLGLTIPYFNLGGEYFSGRGWIPAGEAYILGRWPDGMEQYLALAGRALFEDKYINYYGFCLSADFQPIKSLHIIYRYDLFDPSERFDDDKQNLNLFGVVYELTSQVRLGASYQEQDFQSHKLPISGGEIKIEPFQILSLSLQAKLP